MCMVNASGVEASARPSRFMATIQSWIEVTPIPPNSSGTPAAANPLFRKARMFSTGNVPLRSFSAAVNAKSVACFSANSTICLPASVVAFNSNSKLELPILRTFTLVLPSNRLLAGASGINLGQMLSCGCGGMTGSSHLVRPPGSQDEALVTRQTGMKPSHYLANK